MTVAGTEQQDDSLPPLDDRRDESGAERLDRNTIELINASCGSPGPESKCCSRSC